MADNLYINSNPFLLYNHIQVDEVTAEGSTLYVDLSPEQKNPYGFAHGGILFTLCDCCAGITARADGRSYVTQNANTSFLSNTKQGRITAKSSVVKRGRKTVVIEVKVSDETGKLLVLSVVTMYCTGEGPGNHE